MTKKSLDLAFDASELRNLIVENPDLPLVIFSGSDTSWEDYAWVVCMDMSANIGEVLDCEQSVTEDYIYRDRTEFEDDLRALLENKFDGDDEEFDSFVAEELKKYEPYWKKAIILYVDNN